MDHQMNVLQIDVEDWYMDLDMGSWDSYDARIVQSTTRLLSILEEAGVTATFFVLGYVAEQLPHLVRAIQERGHEIASHGYGHRPIQDLGPEGFEDDLRRSIRILESVSRSRIRGYRAPFFTLSRKTSWAIDGMKRCDLEYDSSIFPVKTHLYGVPDAPLFPYRISSEDIVLDDPNSELLELPLSVYVVPLLRRRVPIAGGFYLRFLPYEFIHFAIRKINRMGKPAVCYLHPWDLDPGKPKIDELRWYHYYRLHVTEGKLGKLLRDFDFESTKEFIEND